MQIQINDETGTVTAYDDGGAVVASFTMPVWNKELVDGPAAVAAGIRLAPSPKVSDAVIAAAGYERKANGPGVEYYGGVFFLESMPPSLRDELCKRWNDYPALVRELEILRRAYEWIRPTQELIRDNADMFDAKTGGWLLPKLFPTLSAWVEQQKQQERTAYESRIAAAVAALKMWAILADDERTTQNATAIINALSWRGGVDPAQGASNGAN